jgi:hypothetical protein
MAKGAKTFHCDGGISEKRVLLGSRRLLDIFKDEK